MNGAQRAALQEMVRIADEMSIALFLPLTGNARDHLRLRWDKARNRYFELEAEARNAKSSASKSRGAVRQKAGANQPKNSSV